MDIAIVNHGQNDLAERCLQSLMDAEDAGALISSVTLRNSAGQFRPSFDVRVTDGENIGYGGACNACAKIGTAPFLLFLNPDVAIQKNTLKIALNHMISQQDAGILGVRLVYPNGQTQPSRMRFPMARDLAARALGKKRRYAECDQSATGNADWVLGAFLLVRREAFEAVGGFCEDFFLYFEEVDLAKRMADAGWRCFYCAEASAVHICGGSGGVSPFCAAQMARSRLIYANRYLAGREFRKIHRRTVFAEPFLRFGRTLVEGKNPFAAFAAPIRGAKQARKVIEKP